MSNHRNPQASVSKQAPSNNFNTIDATELLYSEPVEVDARAVATTQRHEHAASRIVGQLGALRFLRSSMLPRPSNRAVYDGASMLTASTGGAP